MNGLFLDPIDNRVIDFVGGQQDLQARIIRAIGQPDQRFEEDHLRLLRALRFAARLDFQIEPATRAAIAAHAPQLARISPERIAEELRLMLCPATRVRAWPLLGELGLAPVIFRFLTIPPTPAGPGFFARLAPGRSVAMALALAAAALDYLLGQEPDPRELLAPPSVRRMVQAIRKALKISNEESDQMHGALSGLYPLTAAAAPSVAAMKRFLAQPTSPLSRDLLVAIDGPIVNSQRAQWLQQQWSELEKTDYAPAPLLSGDDLTAAGYKPGPIFKRILDQVYDAQLETRVADKQQALDMAHRLASAT